MPCNSFASKWRKQRGPCELLELISHECPKKKKIDAEPPIGGEGGDSERLPSISLRYPALRLHLPVGDLGQAFEGKKVIEIIPR
jgi:hypothetical protein